MPTPNQIDRFIALLAQANVPDDAYNEYADVSTENALRRANLRRYLLHMAEIQPQTLLVMEAPGYRGCRLTGVPVTSRKLLLEGVPELALFGAAQGYQNPQDAGFERIYGEQSATIVWGTLAGLNSIPLIWNTYPFHPHKAEQPLTNRKPRKPELQMGADFLRQMLALFAPQQVIAVGNVAYDTLTRLEISTNKVRHPAQGGKNDFVAGLTALLSG